MKILIYSDYYKHKSGYAREIADLIPHFIKAGHEIAQVALGFNGYPLHKDKDVLVYQAKIESSDYWASDVLEYAIRDFKPDIVLTRQDFFVLPKIAFALSKPNKFKWINWGLSDGEPLGKKLDEPLKWVHSHIFTTEYTKKLVQDVNKEIEGEVIMPPINNETWDTSNLKKAELRKNSGFKKDDILVFCNARNQYRKNLPCLIEAFSILANKNKQKNIILLLASHSTVTSTGQNAGFDLEQLIRLFKIKEGRVLLVEGKNGEMLTDEQLKELYCMSDIFALPTMGEGFGLIYGEAMYSNLPIVTTDYSASGEVCKGKGILVKPRAYSWATDNVKQAVVDPVDFAQAMDECINASKEQKEEWSKNGKEFVEKLKPELVAYKIMKVMEKAISEDVKPLALR